MARSYVSMLVTIRDPAFSTPDDLSPRDRQGHGTAIAMIAAGVQNTGPLGTITGVAPKAFLGNYKVFGSPGVNEYTFRSGLDSGADRRGQRRHGYRHALARRGRPGLSSVRSTQGINVCGDAICDVGAQAVENATNLGTAGGRRGRQRRQYRAEGVTHEYPEYAGHRAQRDHRGRLGQQPPGVSDRARQRQRAWGICAASSATARKSASPLTAPSRT